ncbi:hypothetical protein DOE63_28075 [Salmonella enterica subsp. diarizonae serovar 59:z10:-]|nr:hypothetical protein DOE63_28075 [Salmonella enterica subsp. diarizonae serovar 59:z10:-]
MGILILHGMVCLIFALIVRLMMMVKLHQVHGIGMMVVMTFLFLIKNLTLAATPLNQLSLIFLISHRL